MRILASRRAFGTYIRCMLGSLRIATVRGIPVRLHFSLLILMVVLTVHYGWMGLPIGVLLFSSIALHELGHSVVAQRFGIPIAGINLHLLGGTAVMTETPRSPRVEILIALAGPAVSLVLAIGFGAAAAVFGGFAGVVQPSWTGILGIASAVNLVMAVFNLIPALPMDGGRVLRAALATRLGHLRATRISARVARGIAVAMMLGGVLGAGWQLMMVGGFVFLMAGQEERLAVVRGRGSPFVPPIFAGPGPVIDVTPRSSSGPASFQDPPSVDSVRVVFVPVPSPRER